MSAILYDARGNELLGSIDQIGNQFVTDARTINFTLNSLNAEVAMDLNGQSCVQFQVISASGTNGMICQGTVDGVNWIALSAFGIGGAPITGLGTSWTGATLDPARTPSGIFLVGVGGFRRFRLLMNTFSSGSFVVALRASAAAQMSVVQPFPSMLCNTATAAVNVGVTNTLTNNGLNFANGMFYYITALEVTHYYAVLGVAAAAPNLITSANLGFGASFDQSAATLGTATTRIYTFPSPMKGFLAGTLTTISAPAQLQSIWRITVWYYVGQ